jgi:TolB protein
VSVEGQPPSPKFQLIVADADGENQRLVLESRYPLMSPSWSPDGQWLAYVSFESKRSAVYVQLVRTGERRQVSARAGINGAPMWSPDGKKIALTLGGSSGNPDIYVLELQTQNLTRLTDDPSIDTEPCWSADGKFIYFTSDRAGGPQIYRIGASAGERPKRITFTGNYNARPRLSADGNQLAMVTLDSGNYRVAVQDMSSGNVRVVSKGHLDESPSFAPNGSTIMFSEREANRGILATVSVDGLIGLRLKSEQGEVREPAWGPFAQ